jgi:hypothetical protein
MVYEQLHWLDFNQQVNQPVTAYGQVFPCDIPGGEIGDVQLEMNLTVNLTVPARHRPRPAL